jgi:hypothetical protein
MGWGTVSVGGTESCNESHTKGACFLCCMINTDVLLLLECFKVQGLNATSSLDVNKWTDAFFQV